MRDKIIAALQRLETEKNIRILYAIESGSRAWGFASQNSDWDVRFIYAHPMDWYLSIDRPKDSIEQMLPDDLDLSGWELRKALGLFRKSNPPLLEWLDSPIVYREPSPAIAEMQSLRSTYFNPKSCLYHYLSMAKGNFHSYLQKEQVRLKKYLYVLRPLLCCDWILAKNSFPPVLFDDLVRELVKDGAVGQAIEELLERKMKGRS